MKNSLRKIRKKSSARSKWQKVFDYLESNIELPKLEKAPELLDLSIRKEISRYILGWVRSWFWVIRHFFIYFLIIWFFSILYEKNANQFLYPNLDKDPAYFEEIAIFRESLKEKLKYDIEYKHGSLELYSGEFYADFSNFWISTVRPLADGIELVVSGYLYKERSPRNFKYTLLINNGCHSTVNMSTGLKNSKVEVLSSKANYSELEDIFVNSPILDWDDEKGRNFISLNEGLCDQIFKLCRTKSKKPNIVSKNLGNRMLYYSASTMTGLGLGDIQPLSDRMRLYSILQSLLGLLLVGLFLNSIAKRHFKSQKN